MIHCFASKVPCICCLNRVNWFNGVNQCYSFLIQFKISLNSFLFLWKEDRTQSTAACIPETVWVFFCSEMFRHSSSPTTAEASVRPNKVLPLLKCSNKPLAVEAVLDKLFAISSRLPSTHSFCPCKAIIAELRRVHLVGHRGLVWWWVHFQR